MASFSESTLHKFLLLFNILQTLVGLTVMGIAGYLIKEDNTDFSRLLLLVSFIYVAIGALGVIAQRFPLMSFPHFALVVLYLLWNFGLFITFVFFEKKSLNAINDLEDGSGRMHDWFSDHSSITKIGLASALAFSIIYTGLTYRAREIRQYYKDNARSTLPH